VLRAGYGASVQGPFEVREAVPQTAVILAVTRHRSSTLLNFAAHSPEHPNATEMPFCAPPTDRTGGTVSVQ
jgi:hypothetical protein